MSEPSSNWVEKTAEKKFLITEEKLEQAKKLVPDMLKNIADLWQAIENPNEGMDLMMLQEKLLPQTVSSGGMLAGIQELTPDLMGKTEIQWFQDYIEFSERMLKAVLQGRGNAPANSESMKTAFKKHPAALLPFGNLNIQLSQMKQIFPKQEVGQAI